MARHRCLFKCFLLSFFIVFLTLAIIGFQVSDKSAAYWFAYNSQPTMRPISLRPQTPLLKTVNGDIKMSIWQRWMPNVTKEQNIISVPSTTNGYVSNDVTYVEADDTGAVDGFADWEVGDHHKSIDAPDGEEKATKEDIQHPIILWWTPFTGDPGSTKKCGTNECYFTVDRHYRHHKNTKVFMFYGTDIKFDDLPLPRLPHHEWALLHEESPKNVYAYSHEETMSLFNHTSTFKRESDMSIATQYLESVELLEKTFVQEPTVKKNKYQTEEGLALVNYVHTDCGTPSDRDHLIEMMQKYIKVDSYGKCVHNKDLPEHLRDALKGMDHMDFYKLQAKYKFTMAAENAICDDYMTEKLWRPLFVGSVPIIVGSPKVRDFLPDNHSAIIVDDFKTVKDLTNYLMYLNENDEEYDKYLEFKRTGVKNKYLKDFMSKREWGINNDWKKPNFIDSFECVVCNRLHENIKREKQGLPIKKHIVNANHYGCPKPKKYPEGGSLVRVEDEWHSQEWVNSLYDIKAVREFMDAGKTKFSQEEISKRAIELMRKAGLYL
ncbi:unnamed protein product [Owenia fusiformis]|uniref:Fucosyltransferase n=1 Tax=Owenia fusiformis TaxID=6347 RepID=A0A8S4PL95_OWEFU|nr:unnamed protein product [Owenia fusiformis]